MCHVIQSVLSSQMFSSNYLNVCFEDSYTFIDVKSITFEMLCIPNTVSHKNKFTLHMNSMPSHVLIQVIRFSLGVCVCVVYLQVAYALAAKYVLLSLVQFGVGCDICRILWHLQTNVSKHEI